MRNIKEPLFIRCNQAMLDCDVSRTVGTGRVATFGDAYEYLMGMYASNAGKSGGEYFTPQEVSELLTRIAVSGKTEVNKV